MSDPASWPERYAATALGWDTAPDELVRATCAGLAPGRALVLCAGEGRNALWLAGRGWLVTAVDSSQVLVGRLLGRAALAGVRVDAVTADPLAYRDAGVAHDLVLLGYVHLPGKQLHRLLAVAAPAVGAGGRLLVVGHDASNLDGGYGGPSDPDVLTTAGAIAAVAVDLGLSVRTAQVVRRQVVVEVGVRHVLDHVVEAVRPRES